VGEEVTRSESVRGTLNAQETWPSEPLNATSTGAVEHRMMRDALQQVSDTPSLIPAPADHADFWFDPMCPFTWITSRWMVEVTQVREVELTWRPMSLYCLNEHRPDIPEGYRLLMLRGRALGRVLIATKATYGGAAMGALYTALGTAIHVEQGKVDDRLVERALADAGLPTALADALDDPAHDQPLLVSHKEAMDRVGDEVGSPIIAVNGSAFFGPVLTRIPRGEAAGRLWDGTLAVTQLPYFCEIKRSRTSGPDFT